MDTKKRFIFSDNPVVANFTFEETRKMNLVKEEFKKSLKEDQKNHLDRQVYLYNLLISNIGLSEGNWIWPTKDGKAIPKDFKKKMKKELGLSMNKETKQPNEAIYRIVPHSTNSRYPHNSRNLPLLPKR